MRACLLLALICASPAFCESIAAAQTVAPAADWTRTVTMTPEGGFRMGNPEAAIRIVEFVSLTCPHCRIFAEEGHRHLIDDYVRGGGVSLEIRNLVLDPFDTAAAIVSRCAAPQDYFALNDAILAEQEDWAARLGALGRDAIGELDALPTMEQMARIASLAGLDRIAERHGVAPDRLRACLADANNHTRLNDMLRAAVRLGVAGAPSFLINGKLVDRSDWRGLRSLLRRRT